MIVESRLSPLPENIPVIKGNIYFTEKEEGKEAFSSDLLSCHSNSNCLTPFVQDEYAHLYLAEGEEKAEALLQKINNCLTEALAKLA